MSSESVQFVFIDITVTAEQVGILRDAVKNHLVALNDAMDKFEPSVATDSTVAIRMQREYSDTLALIAQLEEIDITVTYRNIG